MSEFLIGDARRELLSKISPYYGGYHDAVVASLSRSTLAALPPRNAAGVLCLETLAILNNSDLSDGSDLVAWLENLLLVAPLPFHPVIRRARDSAMDGIAKREKQQDPVIVQERIIHRDDSLPIGFLDRARECAKSVAFIRISRFTNGRAAKGVVSGTAWVFMAGFIMTNHHVIAAREEGESPPGDDDLKLQAASAKVWFDFDGGDPPQEGSIGGWQLVAFDASLDYALLRCAGGGAIPDPLRVADVDTDLSRDPVCVNIIQHPRGLAKRIAFRNNLAHRIAGSILYYYTDTQFGSSGSPVCNDEWEVVALHCGSSFQGKGIAYQGKETVYANFGALISAIRLHLEQNFPIAFE